jgi:hypothetical protein
VLSTYVVAPIRDPFTREYGPPDIVPRYTLYPTMFGNELAVQLNVTLCDTGTGVAVPVKFTPVAEAPLIVTAAVDGVNAYPDWLGATT